MSKLKAMILKLMNENPTMRRTRSTSCTGSETADGSSAKRVAGFENTRSTSKPGGRHKPLDEYDIKFEKTCMLEDESTLEFKYAPK